MFLVTCSWRFFSLLQSSTHYLTMEPGAWSWPVFCSISGLCGHTTWQISLAIKSIALRFISIQSVLFSSEKKKYMRRHDFLGVYGNYITTEYTWFVKKSRLFFGFIFIKFCCFIVMNLNRSILKLYLLKVCFCIDMMVASLWSLWLN